MGNRGSGRRFSAFWAPDFTYDHPRKAQTNKRVLHWIVDGAFLYNAILFGSATLLSTFFGVATANAPYYFVAFAVGNLLGPVVLGPLFDSLGRKPMISGTYILSGTLLLVTGYLFDEHQLTAASLTGCWSVVFFFASAEPAVRRAAVRRSRRLLYRCVEQRDYQRACFDREDLADRQISGADRQDL